VLLARAAGARAVLPDGLRALGATVDDIATYEAVQPPGADSRSLVSALESGTIDAITFTSSSTVRNFVALVGDAGREAIAARAPLIASIGPITAAAAEECGLHVDLQPDTYTVAALCDAIAVEFCKADDDTLRPSRSG